jgi:hypothetical protein
LITIIVDHNGDRIVLHRDHIRIEWLTNNPDKIKDILSNVIEQIAQQTKEPLYLTMTEVNEDYVRTVDNW